MTQLITFWACCFRIRTTPYKTLRLVLYEDMIVYTFQLMLDFSLMAARTSWFQNLFPIDVVILYYTIIIRGPHILLCLFYLFFLDCCLSNGTIVGYFSFWSNWRFGLIFMTILSDSTFRMLICYQLSNLSDKKFKNNFGWDSSFGWNSDWFI